MKRVLRAWVVFPVSFTLWFLQGVVLFGGAALNWLGQQFISLGSNYLAHRAYWWLVIQRRIVSGSPRWQVTDFLAGRTPQTADDKARARAAGYAEVRCECGHPDCDITFWASPEQQAHLAAFKRFQQGHKIARSAVGPS